MDHSLPPHLSERFRWTVDPAETDHGAGEFVLYWMHNALRAHENPALDVAICLARGNGLPLLVYHGLSDDYPYASDRIHAFILQGQRDAQRELSDRGIRSYFHVQCEGDRGPHLRDLTRRAAVLVTEEMPTQPLAGWIERLANRTTTPIATVDSSCIVPMALVTGTHSRAHEFRQSTTELYQQRIARAYTEQVIDIQMYDGALPFTSLDLQDLCLSTLISRCRVDHSVAPIIDTPGGSRAGYARWERFKDSGLSQYESRRNDASVHDGTSRMSAYLHFGMVSPLRIAREAHQLNGEKYLDELLIWRELAYHFCFQNFDQIDTLAGLPPWARDTLRSHSNDPRPENLSWESLARARSDHPLWDACQRSLIKHGELHNNVRMTWGKAFLPWTTSPGRSLHLAMDLNHRFALDGRDPCSYGGVLWCFGQFDRPFEPEREIFGRIRTRPLEEHESRIDLANYVRIVDRPICPIPPRVAVVGAGIGGLIAARTLVDHGLQVTVFDKSRGVGGRMATRRRRKPDGKPRESEISFDHGAQYFTARDDRFCRFVQSWIHDGIVQPWLGRIVELGSGGKVIEEKTGTPRYVGAPTMNQVAKHLALDLDVRLETTVARLQRIAESRWQMLDNNEQSLGEFDKVIVNCPPVQAAAIIGDQSTITRQIKNVKMNPTWALMMCLDEQPELQFDGAFINEGPLSWIARDSSKPGRPKHSGRDSWVLHASTPWSIENVERHADDVKTELIEAFQKASGITVETVADAVAHRWRYAIPASSVTSECLWDSQAGIGACGDWCGGSRIEGAFLSGMALAGSLLRHLTIDRSMTVGC